MEKESKSIMIKICDKDIGDFTITPSEFSNLLKKGKQYRIMYRDITQYDIITDNNLISFKNIDTKDFKQSGTWRLLNKNLFKIKNYTKKASRL